MRHQHSRVVILTLVAVLSLVQWPAWGQTEKVAPQAVAAPLTVESKAPPAAAPSATPAKLTKEAARLPIHPALVIGLIAVCVFWMAGVSWINGDALENMIHRSTWTLAMYVIGIAGLVAVHFVHGLYIWAVFGALFIVVVAYIIKRNGEVHYSRQIWTLHHIDRKLGHVFTKLRILKPTKAAEAALALSHISFVRHDGSPAEPEVGKPQGCDVRAMLTLKELISRALAERASTVHLLPTPKEVAVRMRIDGVPQALPSLRLDMGTRVLACIRSFANLEGGKNAAQAGHFSAKFYTKSIDLNVVTQPSPHGETASVRVLNRDADLPRLERTGLRPDQVQRVKTFMHGSSGLCVVCGPEGSGRRTTLYSMLLEVDARARPVTSIENVVEYRLPHVNHLAINPKAGVTYAAALRACLKQDPNVVVVGELPDTDTAVTAATAALKGRLAIGVLNSYDTISALLRLLEMKVEPRLVAASLKLIVAQRLARRLCARCRVPANLRPEQIKKMGLVPGPNVTLFRARGCSACHATGHYGRVGIFETLEITPKIKEMIMAGATAEMLRQEARRSGFLTLIEDGMKKVAGGVISLEEASRCCGKTAAAPRA